MGLTEEDFASIKTMVDSAVGEIGQTFITGKVIKRDDLKKLVWIKELGDQPIPIVDFNRTVDVYSSVAAITSGQSARASSSATFAVTADTNGRFYAHGMSVDYNDFGGTPFSTGRFSPTVAGKYYIGAHVIGMPAGSAQLRLYKNTAAQYSADQHTIATGADGSAGGITTSCLMQMTPSDNAGIWFWSSGGGSTNILIFDIIRLDVPTSSQIQKRTEISTIIVPAVGDTVVVALERGTYRLPRCVGVIQSTGYIRAGDD